MLAFGACRGYGASPAGPGGTGGLSGLSCGRDDCSGWDIAVPGLLAELTC
jgi:hypothetical protein